MKTACAVSPSAGAIPSNYNAAQTAAAAGTDGVKMLPTTAVTASQFTQSETFSAAGVQDLTTTIAGKSVTLHISAVNQWLAVLGYLLVAVTSIACARIVMGGIA
jgi:hypothetical protein